LKIELVLQNFVTSVLILINWLTICTK
jgi:hypothetical protein